MRSMNLSLVWMFILPLSAFCAEQLSEDVFKPYVGRWVGEFTIHSTATGYSEVFPVEQLYWIKDGTLHGVAASDRDSGLQNSRSETVIEGNRLRTCVFHKDSEESFFGTLHEGGILWVPTDLKRVTDYQIKEMIIMEEGERVLKSEGFDSFVFQDGLAHIIYRGSLRYMHEPKSK